MSLEGGLTVKTVPTGSPIAGNWLTALSERCFLMRERGETALCLHRPATWTWAGSEREWDDQSHSRSDKSCLCYNQKVHCSQGTNTGKAQPKGTKAAQGLLTGGHPQKEATGGSGGMRASGGLQPNCCIFHRTGTKQSERNTTNTQLRAFFP